MRKSLFFLIVLMLSGSVYAEKDRLAVMDVTDEDGIFAPRTIVKVTDYIFSKLQETKAYWMVPMVDRDNALEQAIEKTVKGSRKECVDEKCQLSLVAQLQANYLINTKIKKLYEGTCNITISKFDVEKRAGVDSWVSDFNCSEKGLFEAVNSLNFDGKKKTGSTFQTGKIGETVENWEVGTGEETIVKFESNPSDAVVLVDGRIVCQKTPCSKMVAMGKHSITIQRENYVPQEKVFDISKGQNIKTELEPDFGWLNVTGKYTVELKLDGEKIGPLPIVKKPVNKGFHQIEHSNPCYYESGEKFEIKRGETKEFIIPLTPKESAIKVTAQDDKGNDIEADVFVDGNKVGTAPGTFKIPWCSREVIVTKGKLQFKKALYLEEKKVSEINAKLKPSGPKWSKKAPNQMSWYAANKYCENLVEDGSSEWRLPTISELRTLIKNCPSTETGGECKVTNDCLSSNCWSNSCRGLSSADDGNYSKLGDTEWLWSSSELLYLTNNAWYVGFSYGTVGNGEKSIKVNVRCVP